MKVTHFNKGYTIHATEHEMAVLRAIWKHVNWDELKADLSKPQHHAMRRRMSGGFLLRTDVDRRSDNTIDKVIRSGHYEGLKNAKWKG